MPVAQMTNEPRRWIVPCLCLALAGMTFAVFGQTLGFGFIEYDDNLYVYENAQVTGGLSLKGLAWVFTHAECYLYHPLTMVSLMADYQFHGLHAWGYHLTNVLLHATSVLLLFLILRQTTGTLWRSAFVAALFAVHPLRAESVAWVAERKDVLSGFFFMLTLGAYAHYARKPVVVRYLLVVVLSVLALLSKPTMVTLPFLLLLLDYWPLRRVEPWRRLVMEKLPLMALAGAACITTVLVVGEGVAPLARVSILSRLGNALVSYTVYLRQMIWPAGLAVFYPPPQKGYGPGTIIVSFFLLALLSGGVLVFGRQRRSLFVGWLWYLGMLLPMVGLVQVGAFVHADRNTYLPQIGIYVALTWLLADWIAQWRMSAALMVGVVVLLAVCGWKQTAYWKDNETLWIHALACTTNNDVAHFCYGNDLRHKGKIDESIAQYQMALQINPGSAEAHSNLGIDFFEEGKTNEAIAQYQMALQIDPGVPQARNNLGLLLHHQGRLDEAIDQYQKAVQINPDNADARYDLAMALQEKGRTDEAITQYQEALRIKPDNAEALNNFGAALQQKGRMDEAIACYQKAVQIKPGYADAQSNLERALLRQGRVDEAITHFQEVLRIRPDFAEAHYSLGNALLKKGSLDEAISQFQTAVQIKPGSAASHFKLGYALMQKGDAAQAIAQMEQGLKIKPVDATAQNNLAWLLATCPQASLRNGPRAVELARQVNSQTGGENADVLSTFAAALSEAGRFPEAVETAQHALQLAEAQSNSKLAQALQSRIKLYQEGSPFHTPEHVP